MTSKDLLRIEAKADDSSINKLLCIKKTKTDVPSSSKTFKLPPSSVLSQVKQFLPQMAAENKKLEDLLETVPASAVDIENVTENDPHYIEMNLAVVEHDSSSDDDSDSDLESSSDSDHCNGVLDEVTEDNIKFSRERSGRKIGIEEINDEEKGKKNLHISELRSTNGIKQNNSQCCDLSHSNG